MYYYAVLDIATNICIGVEGFEEELTGYDTSQVIPIDSNDQSLVGKVYNFETGQFEDPDETDACTITASQISLNSRRLDLFLGDETGLSVGDNTIDNLVDAVNACFQSASDGKEAIATAITGVNSGLTIPENPTFAQLSALIGQLGALRVETGSMSAFTIPETIEGTTSFRPKIVIVYNFGSGLSNFNMGVYVSPEITGNTTQQISDSANGIGNTLSRRASAFTITDTGFSMANTGAVTTLKWIALG